MCGLYAVQKLGKDRNNLVRRDMFSHYFFKRTLEQRHDIKRRSRFTWAMIYNLYYVSVIDVFRKLNFILKPFQLLGRDVLGVNHLQRKPLRIFVESLIDDARTSVADWLSNRI